MTFYHKNDQTRLNAWVSLKMGKKHIEIKVASAGNRTRAARVAGEHSTTEPLMLGKGNILAASHGYPKKEART